MFPLPVNYCGIYVLRSSKGLGYQSLSVDTSISRTSVKVLFYCNVVQFRAATVKTHFTFAERAALLTRSENTLRLFIVPTTNKCVFSRFCMNNVHVSSVELAPAWTKGATPPSINLLAPNDKFIFNDHCDRPQEEERSFIMASFSPPLLGPDN